MKILRGFVNWALGSHSKYSTKMVLAAASQCLNASYSLPISLVMSVFLASGNVRP